MRIRFDDRVFEGTPLQIVQIMRSIAFRTDATVREYMQWVAGQIEMLGGKVELTPETSDEDCAAELVAAMIEQGMAHKS